jgi:S-adenosylmethionine decarboxylase
VRDAVLLGNMQMAKAFFDRVIPENKLSRVGEVYHQFDGGGYTAVICLTESHISIHTWPEFNRVTFDVFLSNFMNYNHDIVESIHSDFLIMMQAEDINTTRLSR